MQALTTSRENKSHYPTISCDHLISAAHTSLYHHPSVNSASVQGIPLLCHTLGTKVEAFHTRHPTTIGLDYYLWHASSLWIRFATFQSFDTSINLLTTIILLSFALIGLFSLAKGVYERLSHNFLEITFICNLGMTSAAVLFDKRSKL